MAALKRRLDREVDKTLNMRPDQFKSDRLYFQAVRKRFRRVFLLRRLINRLRTARVKGRLDLITLMLRELNV